MRHDRLKEAVSHLKYVENYEFIAIMRIINHGTLRTFLKYISERAQTTKSGHIRVTYQNILLNIHEYINN